ncbi:MAG TPA: hypothetical protein VHK86_07900 [Nitrososphaera sp.]|nr:hypothetical protein [Nitrososphaera sp.]
MSSSLEMLAKSGAIVSSTGVALFVAFVAVLLVFPVVKECDNDGKCSFSSAAPEQLRPIVQPGFLAFSLAIIAAGVFMVRYGRWRDSKKTESSA